MEGMKLVITCWQQIKKLVEHLLNSRYYFKFKKFVVTEALKGSHYQLCHTHCHTLNNIMFYVTLLV